MPTVEFNDRSHAIKWILTDKRYSSKDVYCSYSSLKMYRDCGIPFQHRPRFFIFGTEIHSQFLEKKSTEKLNRVEKALMKLMLMALWASAIVRKLMTNVKVEQVFKKIIHGMHCCGRIDILAKTYVADLKTTSCTNLKAFIASMDFLQVAMYLAATGLKDFYYIGISKKFPYRVFIFNARDYPERLEEAKKELKKYLLMLKKDLAIHIKNKHANNNRYTRTKTIVQRKKANVKCGRLHHTKTKRKVSH